MTQPNPAPQKFAQRSTRSLLPFVLLLVVLYAIGVWWGMPSEFSPAVDSLVPYSPLGFVAEYSNPHIAYKYPAVHQILLLPLYVVVFIFMKLSGNWQSVSSTWPYGFRDPYAAFSMLIVVSRLVSVLMAAGIVIGLKFIRFEIFDRRSQWIAMILLAGSGLFTYYARVGNVDVPYVFWWVLSFIFLWKYIFETPRWKHLVLSAVFSSLSIGTKDQAVGLVLGSGLIILLIPFEGLRANWKTRIKKAAIFAGITLLAYVIVAVLPQPLRWLEHVRFWRQDPRAITDFIRFENTFSGQFRLLQASISALTHILPTMVLFFVLIGIFHMVRTGQYNIVASLLLSALSYYGLIIFNIRYVFDRFLLPVAWIAVIFAGIGMTFLLQYLQKGNPILRLTGYVLVSVILGYHIVTGYLPVTFAQTFDTKRNLAQSLSVYVPKGSPIVWEGGTEDLPNSDVYRHYDLMLPQGKQPRLRSFAHVFRPYDPNFVYVLSQKPLRGISANFELLHSWRYPDWVRNLTFAPCIKEFYLYRRLPSD